MPNFVTSGRKTGTIEVKISYKIIRLFSEGLYSSSSKAIEELVCNAFDAGARNVHVLISPSLTESDATIAVIDDGEGMDKEGLKRHWLIGVSNKRSLTSPPRERKQIGKFGIGKLATFVLANRLSHVSKRRGKYYAASMDFTKLDFGEGAGLADIEKIPIPLRVLSASQAEAALRSWTSGAGAGYEALKLFGDNAPESWTIAIMSDLKEMGQKTQRGRLRWVLSTAMPLRDDFQLYLNGQEVKPAKVDADRIQTWTIGKDIRELPGSGRDEIECVTDERVPKNSRHYYGLTDPELGRISGYVELFANKLTDSKSDETERSNGFFVYARERLINAHDPGFYIPRNELSHGTFSRFRAVVYMDSLDEELRSSRETVRQGSIQEMAVRVLKTLFNIARNRLAEYERTAAPGAQFSERLAAAPGSLTRRPMLRLLRAALAGEYVPVLTKIPEGLDQGECDKLLKDIAEKEESLRDLFRAEPVELSSQDAMAVYDVRRTTLCINTAHPFVATFLEEYENPSTRLPLQMLAMSEVLWEAYLFESGLAHDEIRGLVTKHDHLLRRLVRASGRRSANAVAASLLDAKDDQLRLETEVVACYDVLGYVNARHIGGRHNPDGTAEAPLAGSTSGARQRYKLVLEAKSGGLVTAERLGVSRILRHMNQHSNDQHSCDHAVVVGNRFATSSGEDSASIIEIQTAKRDSGKTITLMHVDDLARLVRLAVPRRLSLVKLREMLTSCISPEETARWIDEVEKSSPKKWKAPYKEILEAIWKIGDGRPDEPVEYQSVGVELQHRTPPVSLSRQEIIDDCRFLELIAPESVSTSASVVELARRLDLVLEDVRTALRDQGTT